MQPCHFVSYNQQPVQAMDTLKLAIQKLRPEMPDGLKLLAYTQYARVSRDAGKPRQALQYYRKAMSYQNTTHNKANIANLEYLYGYMLFHDTDSLLQARNYVMKAADFARKNPSRLLPKILLTLAEIEGRRNNGQLAYQLMLEAYQANEKLNDQYYQNRLSGFEAELDLKEKDLQIAGLNGKRAEEKAAYLIRTYTIGGILILALLLLIILVISMHKTKDCIQPEATETGKRNQGEGDAKTTLAYRHAQENDRTIHLWTGRQPQSYFQGTARRGMQ